MKNLIVILLLLVGAIWLTGCNQPNALLVKPPEKSRTEIIQSAKESVVHILVLDEAGNECGQCSGFLVAPPEPNAFARVVTNRHCFFDVPGAARAVVILSETTRRIPIRYIVAEDSAHDLLKVSIELSGATVHPLTLTDKLPEQGESIFVIGSPLGLPGIVTPGTVLGTPVLPEIGSVILTDAIAAPGVSGGAMINASGIVLGVITFGVDRLNFALPASRVLAIPGRKPQLLSEWLRARQEERINNIEE